MLHLTVNYDSRQPSISKAERLGNSVDQLHLWYIVLLYLVTPCHISRLVHAQDRRLIQDAVTLCKSVHIIHIISYLGRYHQEPFDACLFRIRRPREVVPSQPGAVQHVRDAKPPQQLDVIGVSLAAHVHVIKQANRKYWWPDVDRYSDLRNTIFASSPAIRRQRQGGRRCRNWGLKDLLHPAHVVVVVAERGCLSWRHWFNGRPAAGV